MRSLLDSRLSPSENVSPLKSFDLQSASPQPFAAASPERIPCKRCPLSVELSPNVKNMHGYRICTECGKPTLGGCVYVAADDPADLMPESSMLPQPHRH